MCLTPLYTIANTRNGREWIKSPCGRCEQCLMAKQNEWVFRCMYELANTSQSCFFTLTYNNDSVPQVLDTKTGELHNSLNKKDIQNWLKLCRESLYYKFKKRLAFKYLISGEYGPTTLRPHAHGVLIGVDKFTFLTLFATHWTKGFIDVSDIDYNNESFNTVAKYISLYSNKGDFFNNPKVKESLVSPQFKLVSKHFGEGYVDNFKDYHLCTDLDIKKYDESSIYPGKYNQKYLESVANRLRVEIFGKTFYLPTYFRTKIFGQKTILSKALRLYLYSTANTLHFEKLEQIRAKQSLSSIHEADYQVNIANSQQIESKRQQLRRILSKKYLKTSI